MWKILNLNPSVEKIGQVHTPLLYLGEIKSFTIIYYCGPELASPRKRYKSLAPAWIQK